MIGQEADTEVRKDDVMKWKLFKLNFAAKASERISPMAWPRFQISAMKRDT